jgi:hypothetical protein
MLVKDQKTKRLPVIFPINVHAFAETTASGEVPREIHVLPVGKWNHPAYGPIVIEREDVAQFKENFDAGLRKGIPITEGHDNGMSGGELPAIGWFTELIDRGANGLYAVVEWTNKGKTLLAEKAFKYFSPEFYSEYEDPETRTIHNNVLVGGALTNKPYFKELEAVVLSEPKINNQFNFNETMNLQELLAKKVEDLSDEEKAFIVEHKGELNDEQKETFKSVLDTDGGDGEGEGEGDGEGTEGGDEGTEGGDEGGEGEGDGSGEGDGEGTEGDGEGEGEGQQQNASEFKTDKKGNVIMTMAEVKALTNKANAGYEASEKLRKAEIKAEASKLVFSEQNSNGRILPKHEAKVLSFMEGLNDKQRKEFSEIVSAIPATQIFNERGHGGNTEGSAASEVENLAKKVMSENKGMQYADAVTQVFSENPELAKRYERELV